MAENTDGMEEYVKAARDRDDMLSNPLTASSKCPVCGIDTPHPHSTDELTRLLLQDRKRIIVLEAELKTLSTPAGDSVELVKELRYEYERMLTRDLVRAENLYKAAARIESLERENERICTAHKGMMKLADERAERAEAALAISAQQAESLAASLRQAEAERDEAQRIAINKDSDLDAAKLERAQMKEAWQEGIAALKAELAEANAVLRSPAKWHKWCDIRVLEQLEAVKAELARKDELIDDLRAMHGVPSDADLARARDEEARSCADLCDLEAANWTEASHREAEANGAYGCAAAIELRISERAK